MANFRIERVNEEIKKVISYVIQNQIKSTSVTGIITVTNVDTTKDFKYSKIYLSILDSKKEIVFEELKKFIPLMRKNLASKLNLRIVPEINLKLDDSIEYGFQIDNILKQALRKE